MTFSLAPVAIEKEDEDGEHGEEASDGDEDDEEKQRLKQEKIKKRQRRRKRVIRRKPSSTASKVTFIKSDSFNGAKSGFVFKTGPKGVGYYQEAKK